jgi:HemY protein
MLIALFRLLVFIGLVIGGTWAVNQLLQAEGGIMIEVGGYQQFLSPIAAAALLIGGFIAIAIAIRLIKLLYEVLRFLTGDERAFKGYFERSREKAGLKALSLGMTALASGDAKRAVAKARKAEQLLRRPELTRLLNAQAAELAGDTRRARRYYKAMASEEDTAFIGLKGLLGQALKDGERDKALRLAERAFELNRTEPLVLDTLYHLQSQAFDWQGARRTLAAQKKIGVIDLGEANRRDATLALAQAEDASGSQASGTALRLSVEAAKLDPANTDAVVAAVRHLVADGQKRQASRQVIEAWRIHPSPQLAAAFAQIEPEESQDKRRKRFGRLIEANPGHRETLFLRAELALMAEDWAEARRAIEDLGEEDYSARTCARLARERSRSLARRGERQPDRAGGDAAPADRRGVPQRASRRRGNPEGGCSDQGRLGAGAHAPGPRTSRGACARERSASA